MPRRGCTRRATTGGKTPSQENRKDPSINEGVDGKKMNESHSAAVEEPTALRRGTRNRTPAKLVQVVVNDPKPRKSSSKASPRTRKQVAQQDLESDQQLLSDEQSHFDLPHVSQQVILQDQGSDQQELSGKRSQKRQQVVQQEPEADKQQLSELSEEKSQGNLRRSRRQIALQLQESEQKKLIEETSRLNLRRSRRQVILKEHESDEQQLAEEQPQLDLPRTRRQVTRTDHGSDQQLSEEQPQLDLPRTRRQVTRTDHGSDEQLSEEQPQLDLPRTRRQVTRTDHGSDQQLSAEQPQLDLPRTRRQVTRTDHGSDQQLSEEQPQLDLPRTRRQVTRTDHGSNQQLSEEQPQSDLPRTRRQDTRTDHGSDQQLSEEQPQLDLPRTRRQVTRTDHGPDQQLSEEQPQLDLPRTRRQVTRTDHGSDQQLSEEQPQLDLPRTRRQVTRTDHGSNQQLSEEQPQSDLPRTRRQVTRTDHGSDQQLSEEQPQLDLPRTRRHVTRTDHGLDQQLSEEQPQLDLPRTRRQVTRTDHGSDQQLSEEQPQLDLPRTRRQVTRTDHGSDQQLSEEQPQLDLPRTRRQVTRTDHGSDQQLSEEQPQLDLPRTRRQVTRTDHGPDQQLSEEKLKSNRRRSHRRVTLKKHGSDEEQCSKEPSQLDLPKTRQEIAVEGHGIDQNLLPKEELQLDRPSTRQKVVLKEKQSDSKQLSEERSQMDPPPTCQQIVPEKQGSIQQQLSDEQSHQHNVLQKQKMDQEELLEGESKSDIPHIHQKAILQKQQSDEQQVIEQEQRSDQQKIIQQEQRSNKQQLSEDWSQLEGPCTHQENVPQEQGLTQQLPKDWSQLDHPCRTQKVTQHRYGSDHQQLLEERTQKQSLMENNHSKNMGVGLESEEQITKWGHQEEFKDMQAIHSAGQNANMDMDQIPNPEVSSSSPVQQGLNVSNRDVHFMKQSARDDQNSSEEHISLAKESCDSTEQSIGNPLKVGVEYQHENDAKEIKNDDNSQRLQLETAAIDNQITMLPTAPVTSKTRSDMGNAGNPNGQFVNPDAFVQQAPRDFSFKFPYPCQMKTADVDNKGATCQSTIPRTKQSKTKHSQGHSLTEPFHLQEQSTKEPSHHQEHSAKELSHHQEHSAKELSHHQEHSAKELSHHQEHSAKELSHHQGYSAKEPSYVQGYFHLHKNHIDDRSQSVFTGHSMQKEFGKDNSAVPPGTVSGESSSAMQQIFYGSEQKQTECLDLSYRDAHLISAGNDRRSIEKAVHVDDKLLSNNTTLCPTNVKQARKSELYLNKTDDIATQMNLHDHNKTKPEFLDQSSVLNKSNPSPFPTSWSPVGEKTMPPSTSHQLLPQNTTLSSLVPIASSYSGKKSPAEVGAKKHNVNSYPNDAHSAPPPVETCSSQSMSMRSSSVPVFTQLRTKSPFCCDECTRSGGVSEKCSNRNSRFSFERSLDSNSESNFGHVAHSDPQKLIQSAFTSAQNIPYNDNHSFKKSFCDQNRSTSTCCASSTSVSTLHKPSVSVIKNDPSSQSLFPRNIVETTSASSPCLPPQHAHFMHPQHAHFMHPQHAHFMHKAPPSYQASSVLNMSNRASHNNNLTHANSIHTSHSNNNLTVKKPPISLSNNKVDKTMHCAPSEETTNFQPPDYPRVSTSQEGHKLTHICSAPNMVTPSYTSSIYTSSSNTATYISSTQSSQSRIRIDSTSSRYVKPPNFLAPPSYAEVIRQKNSISKNHDLVSQNVSNCKKLLWQPFSEEKPMIHIKNEVITGTYPGEVPTSSQMPSSQTSSSQTPSSSSIPYNLSVFAEPHPIRQHSVSTHHPSQQAVHTKYDTQHPMHPPDMRNQQTMTKLKINAKPRLGENGTSLPSAYKQRKVPQREVPPAMHGDSKQVPSWIPKVESNPADMKNEIKCTFKIKNAEFSEANFQNAFLNSFPKNTNIPLDKINQISNALNETTKRVFNNNHSDSGPAPPHGADGRKTPDRKPTIIKSEPQLGPDANGSTMEPDPGSDPDDLFTRLKTNKKMEIPLCGCLGPEYVPNETVEGPYYTHLGTGSCIADIQKMMEERTGLTGKAVRIESIIYSGKEGKSSQGCPIAKWIVRRPGVEEKILCLVRQRRGHFCPTACIVICIVAWEGVPKSVADDMYSYLVPTLTQYGLETDRRCGYNEQKTCACQGVDMKKRGASFSFGCSWSMYFNGCKFARSREAKRFRLKDQSLDEIAEGKFQNLATRLAPLYKSIAPESYQNQVFFEDKGYECRLGHRIENDEKPCRPFSGVTACVDFCAHAHKDLHNMNNGCTVVVTLTKHGPLERPAEEQLHVLPLYILDATQEALEEKIKSGCIEILPNYPKVARIRSTPFIPKRKLKKSKKDGMKISNKKENKLKSKVASQVTKNSAPVLSDKLLKAAKNISGLNSKNKKLANKVNLFQNASKKSPQLTSSKVEGVTTSDSSDNAQANKRPGSEKQLNNANMYNEFWKYFYCYGTFPPANFLNDVNSADTMRFFATHLSDAKPIFPPPLDKSAAAQLLQHPAEDLRKDMPTTRPGSASSIPLGKPSLKDLKSHFPVSNLTADDFESPLHLLSEAVMIRSQTSLEKPRPAASHPQAGTSMSTPRKPVPNSELSSSIKIATSKGGVGLGNSLHPQFANQALPNANIPVESPQDQHSRFSSVGPQFVQKNIFDTTKSGQPQSSNEELSSQTTFTGENVSRADCPDGCMRDTEPEVIRAELEYNEQNFYDPEIGGVAIALTHGSVLFEVAKRELHATTALLNPNRFSPTRISLVFYQHKSMNLRYHGWYENERKLELQRQKRLQKLQEEAEKNKPIDSSELKPGNKKRRKKDEPPPPPAVKFSAQYMPMWPTIIKHTITQTTNSIITQWIDPQPTVSGPYQKWI